MAQGGPTTFRSQNLRLEWTVGGDRRRCLQRWPPLLTFLSPALQYSLSAAGESVVACCFRGVAQAGPCQLLLLAATELGERFCYPLRAQHRTSW